MVKNRASLNQHFHEDGPKVSPNSSVSLEMTKLERSSPPQPEQPPPHPQISPFASPPSASRRLPPGQQRRWRRRSPRVPFVRLGYKLPRRRRRSPQSPRRWRRPVTFWSPSWPPRRPPSSPRARPPPSTSTRSRSPTVLCGRPRWWRNSRRGRRAGRTRPYSRRDRWAGCLSRRRC